MITVGPMSISELFHWLDEQRVDLEDLRRAGAEVITTGGGVEVVLQFYDDMLREARRLRERREEQGRNWTSFTVSVPYMQVDDSEEQFDDDDDGHEPFDEEEKIHAVARMLPDFQLPKFNGTQSEFRKIFQDFTSQIEYRLKWIFYREEKEGFRRRHNLVQPFSPKDFYEKVEKSSRPHPMNTEISVFHDWNFGSTDFIMRMEGFTIDGIDCLRCHFIHKPTNVEVGYQDRIWDGTYYREVNMKWAHVN